MYVILVTCNTPRTNSHLSDVGSREKTMLLNKLIRGWSWEICHALQIKVNWADLACHQAFAYYQDSWSDAVNTEDSPLRSIMIILWHNTAIFGLRNQEQLCMRRLNVCPQENPFVGQRGHVWWHCARMSRRWILWILCWAEIPLELQLCFSVINSLNIWDCFSKFLQIRILGFNILGCPDNFLNCSSLFLDQQANIHMLHKYNAGSEATYKPDNLLSFISSRWISMLAEAKNQTWGENHFRCLLSDPHCIQWVSRREETLKVIERHTVKDIVGGRPSFSLCQRSTHHMHQLHIIFRARTVRRFPDLLGNVRHKTLG